MSKSREIVLGALRRALADHDSALFDAVVLPRSIAVDHVTGMGTRLGPASEIHEYVRCHVDEILGLLVERGQLVAEIAKWETDAPT